MGCAQAKPSMNSPAWGLEKLKLENGYAGKSDFVAHRRSTGKTRVEETNRPHRPQARNYNARVSSGEGRPGSGDGKDGGEKGNILTREGKRDGSVRRISSQRSSSSNSLGEDELVDGWPKWLVDNIPRDVLTGLVPKSADSYDKLDKVGQGTYSNVYKAQDRNTGKIVALKKVKFDTSEPESVKFMAREIMILQKLDHPNVVKLEGLATSRMHQSLYLVFEFMQTDLGRIISRPEGRLTEPQIKCYMHQLLSGLQHCHDKGILHRDIKGSNLLIDKNGMLKIADFGLANYFNPKSRRRLTNRVVTLWYRAPELLLGGTDYGVGIDLWSAGCLLAEMFTGKPILPGRTEVEQLHRIFKLCGTPSEEYWRKLKLSSTLRPPKSYKPSLVETFKDFPTSSLGLLSTLLALDPAYRGSASLSLKNEFFYTSPLACDLSGLPVVYSEEAELKQANELRKIRNSKMKQRSRTIRERRTKDLTSEKLKEDSVFFKEEVEKRADANLRSEEGGSTTTTSTSSGVNTARQKESPIFLPFSVPSPTKISPQMQDHPDATENLPPLPKSRRYSTNLSRDNITCTSSRVRRSTSTREFRTFYKEQQLKLFDV